MWLIAPGEAVSREARGAPIPPRLADSIERKKPTAIHEAQPEPAKPMMQEATVSLTSTPTRTYKIRELTPSPPIKQKRKPRGEQSVAQAAAFARVSVAPAVTTGRSDVPY